MSDQTRYEDMPSDPQMWAMARSAVEASIEQKLVGAEGMEPVLVFIIAALIDDHEGTRDLLPRLAEVLDMGEFARQVDAEIFGGRR